MWQIIVPNPLLQEQLACDQEAMLNSIDYNYPHFNPEQKVAFDKVVNSAKNNEGKIFHHSTGGGGKTHVSNIIAAVICENGHTTLGVTSSTIAALLLHGGCTAHSHFKISIPIDDSVAMESYEMYSNEQPNIHQ